MRRHSSISGFLRRTAAGAVIGLSVVAAGGAAAAAEPGFSGMQLQGVGERIAKALGIDKPSGVRRGDLIVGFAGTEIDSFNRLIKAAQATLAGQEVTVEVLRGGKAMSLRMTLGRKPAAWQVASGAIASLPDTGLTLATITPKIREHFNLRWGAIGVLVTLIDPEHAKRTVMKRGDVIVQVNQQDVWLPEQVVAAYQDAKTQQRDRLLLLVGRLGAHEFMLLPVR